MTAYSAITPEKAKVLQNIVKDQLKAAKSDLQATQKFLASAKGTVEAQTAAHASAIRGQASVIKLAQRLAALQKGFDIVEARKVDPARVGTARPRLTLPPAYVVPNATAVAQAAKLVGRTVARMPGETTSSWQIRQRAILQRALVRVVAAQAANPTTSASALVPDAIVQTVAQDGQAIKEEAQAAGPEGGVVPDPAAEAMDPIIDAATADAVPADSSGSSPLLYVGLAAAAAAAAKFMGFF